MYDWLKHGCLDAIKLRFVMLHGKTVCD
uniref:Uncharacterized protein n=1 Tax=Arundo donax TaxID=35708 RepID=A0A0A9CB78_ARUDO